MFCFIKRVVWVQGGNVKIKQNMWDFIPLKWDVEDETFGDGYFLEAEVWVRETKECRVAARDGKVEN